MNFTMSKNLIGKSVNLPHGNIDTWTWISPDAATHNQVNNVPVDMRRQLSLIDTCSLRGADCEIDYYLVFATIRCRLPFMNGINKT